MNFTSQEIGRDIYFKSIDQEGNRSQYWNDDLCVMFVLSGDADITVSGERFSLGSEDIVVVERFTPYTMQMDSETLVLCMYINVSFLRSHNDILSGRSIRCCSALSDDRDGYNGWLDQIRGHMARIFTAFYKNQDGIRLFVYEETLAMLRCIDRHFANAANTDEMVHGDRMRLRRVLEYINNSYTSQITLEQMASAEFLSTGYFSRFFSKYAGTSFTQYLKTVRLGHAHHAICNTSESITNIALNNGFSNTNSFIAAFREVYGMTPGEYRKDAAARRREKQLEVTEQPVNDAFRPLAKYVNNPGTGLKESAKKRPVQFREIEIDCETKQKPLPQTWRNLLTVGWAKEMLLAPVQEQIRQCQEEIGFRYVRFHGLLDDDMIVYREDEKGKPIYNFSLVDLLFDFILSVDLRPYVEFSYIPSALARDEQIFFGRSSYVTMPEDMDKWKGLVSALIRHWIKRYGIEEVSSWKYVVINGYCVFLGLFTMEEYTSLYENTYRSVKKLVPEADFGGPGCDIGMLNLKNNKDWDDFFNYCEVYNCIPDFVNVQCFHSEYKESALAVYENTATHKSPPGQISANENYLADNLHSLRSWLKRRGIKKPRILLETWNSTTWQRDLCSDTCFKAAFLAKNIIANGDRLEGMGYWTLSDFMEELPVEQEIFHGGYGLFTYNGIPKSGYYALHMLHRLGEDVIEKNENYIVTVKNKKIRIMAYNYCHYDMLYQKHYSVQGDRLDRYQVFAAKTDNHLRFSLKNLIPGEYEIESYTVSREGGSSFDAWVRMGAPSHLRPSRQDYLKSISTPVYAVAAKSAENGEMDVEVSLKPHQVTTLVISLV